MASNDDVKIGLALLKEVESNIDHLYGNIIAKSPGAEYDVKFDNSNKELQKQLEIAEKKLYDSQEGLAYSSFLRGRLLAIKQSPVGNRAMLQCAEHYKKAIDLGYNKALVLYYWGMHNKAWNNKEAAISQFEQIVNIEGTNSELGLETAKEIEKTKAMKKGGCFIATAVYGSYHSPEVLILREFRDRVLLGNAGGKLFVRFYYFISPPFADFISNREILKKGVRLLLIEPVVKFVEAFRREREK